MNTLFQEIIAKIDKDEEEEIFWKIRKETNEKPTVLATFLLDIVSIAIILASGILLYVFLQNIWYLLILLIGTPLVYKVFIDFKKFKSKASLLEIPLKSLANYENFYLLTTKRWIQKSINLTDIKKSLFPKDGFILEKDVVYLDLNLINVISLSLEKFYPKKEISFFINYDGIHHRKHYFKVVLNQENYSELVDKVRYLFKIEQEKKLGSGHYIYFVKKR
jgi:hypothetical protein